MVCLGRQQEKILQVDGEGSDPGFTLPLCTHWGEGEHDHLLHLYHLHTKAVLTSSFRQQMRLMYKICSVLFACTFFFYKNIL